MSKKIISKKYELSSDKIKKDIKIFLISDIHISSIFKRENINIIISEIKREKVDYICIAGDLIDGNNILDEKDNYSFTIDFLKKFSTMAKVIISIGNHDVSSLLKNSFHTKWKYERKPNFFKDVSNIKNVILLDNEMYSENDINFIGFTPSYHYYWNSDGNSKQLIEDMNSTDLDIPKDKYNVLLCHSPIHVFNDEVLANAQMMKNIDLVLSGHMHNGMVPPFLEKIWHGNSGLITPNKTFFPKAKTTRGMIKKNKKILIISGGITKLSYSAPNFLHPFDDFFPMNVEIVNICKKD